MRFIILLILMILGFVSLAQIEKVNDERQLSTINWLKSKNIRLNQLPHANPGEINYNCDSALFLKQTKNDTTVIWAYGSQRPLDTSEVIKFIHTPEYGKTSYLSEVYKTGKVKGVDLMPYTFYTKKDSLFELETFYHISRDSLMNLYDTMIAYAIEYKNGKS